jgi:drug/metabolite transporter (DMT)-like permease
MIARIWQGATKAEDANSVTVRLTAGASPVSRSRLIAAFAAIYLLWGATFLAIRYAVAEVPPLLTIGVRCAGGAAILALWLACRRQLERPTARQWLVAGAAGVLLFVGGHGVLAWAEQRVPSGQAALYSTSLPLWLVLLDALRTRTAPAVRVLVSIGLGIAGIALLTHAGGSAGAPPPGAGDLAERVALAGYGLFWAAGSLLGRHGARPLPALQSAAMQLGGGAVAMLGASAACGELAAFSPAGISQRALLALAFLVLGGTVIGFGAYTWLMRVATPAAVGTTSFVNPLVALGLAWLAGDEAPSGRTAVAALLVIAAVVLTRSRPGQPQPARLAANGAGAGCRSALKGAAT